MSLFLPVLLVALVFFIGAIVFAAFALGQRSKMKSVAQPCCAACRYPVQGLTSLNCPECGSDLRLVGILTPAMRRPLGPWLAIMLWTLLLPIPAVVISGLLSSTIIPSDIQREQEWQLGALSPPAQVIDLIAESSRWEWPLSQTKRTGAAPADHVDRVSMQIVQTSNLTAPPDAILRVDFRAKEWWTDAQPERLPLDTLSENAMGEFLGRGSADAASEDALPGDSAAGALCNLIDSAASGPRSMAALQSFLSRSPVADHFSARQIRSSGFGGPVRGAMPALALFWFLIWLLGCVFFYRRSARPAS